MPKFLLVTPTDDPGKFFVMDQKLFQYRIGMCLFLIKHSKPDIANTTPELLKVMDGVNQATFLEMHQVIKYVLNNRSFGKNQNQEGVIMLEIQSQ